MLDESFIIRKNTVSVSGVKGHHLIMHISDSHLCCFDDKSTLSEIEYAKERELFWKGFKYKFAAKSCENITSNNDLETKVMFEKIISYADFIKPELLIISGDTLEIMSPAGERYLNKVLSKYSGKYICVPGNHEGNNLNGIWNDTPKVYRGNGFNIVGFDNSQKTVSYLAIETLKTLIDEKTPLFPVYHMPISTEFNKSELNMFDEYFLLDENSNDINANEFVKLIKNSNVIKAAFCGHVHVYNKSEISPNKPQICCSSSMIGNIHLIDICE